VSADRRVFARVGLAAAVLLAVALRLYHVGWGLPAYVFPDETVLPDIARKVVQADARGPGWPAFGYPHWQVYTLRAAWCAAGVAVPPGDPTEVARQIQVGRYVTVALSVGTVVLTYVVGARLYGAVVGALAAIVLALAPYHVLDSHTVNNDVPMTFWVVASFLAAVLARDGGRFAALLAGAVLAGLAIATKYNAVFALIPLLWVALWKRRSLAAAAACAAIAVVAFFAACPLCLRHADQWLQGVGVIDSLHREHGGWVSITGEGWVSHRYVYQLVAALPFALGWPLYLFALAGVAIGLRRRDDAAALLLAFVVPYLLFMGAMRSTFPRYYVPLLPFLAVFAALAIERATAARGVRAVVALAAVAVALGYTTLFAVSLCRELSVDDRREAAAWLVEATRRDGAEKVTIAMPRLYQDWDGLAPALRDDPHLALVDFHPDASFIERTRPTFIVLSRAYENHFRRGPARAPETMALQALDDGALGYRLAKEIRSGYFSDVLYASLDPAFEALWAHGRVGFRIYEKTRP